MNTVVPRLDTLPQAQRALWPRLSEVGPDFVLYGGTALSLQVGGRISIDFDFFSKRPLEIDLLWKRVSFLKESSLQQRADDTATFIVGEGPDLVAVSFFGNLGFGRVSDPVKFSDNGVVGAGLLDLAAQKMKVIQQRAEAKDYQDIHTLLSTGISLEEALGACCALYANFNPAISLKALSYFGDIGSLPQNIRNDLSTAASRVREIPKISKLNDSLYPDRRPESKNRELGESAGPTRDSKKIERDLEI